MQYSYRDIQTYIGTRYVDVGLGLCMERGWRGSGLWSDLLLGSRSMIATPQRKLSPRIAQDKDAEEKCEYEATCNKKEPLMLI
jgi:hypothetical protein